MRQALYAVVPVVVSLALVGCSDESGGVERSEVTGVVTFQGQPVPAGTITFNDPATGQAASAELSEEGEYLVLLPDGTYNVTITPPLVEAQSQNPNISTGQSYKEVENIPRKYHTESGTDLTAKVGADALTHDFDLKP